MPDYLGADFGPDKWFLAKKDSVDSHPVTLQLGTDRQGFPAVLAYNSDRDVLTGEDAYAQRHEVLSRTLIYPNAASAGSWQKLAAMRKVPLGQIQQTTQQALLEELLASQQEYARRPLAVALPQLDAATWKTFVTALSCTKWKTRLFVSDWVAALFSAGRPDCTSMVLISAGWSNTRCTASELQQDHWRVLRRAEYQELCLRQVHEKLVARLAAHAAVQLQRDPLQRDRNYIAVHTAVDESLQAMQAMPLVQQVVPMFGEQYLYQLSRGDAAAAAGASLEPVRDFLRQALAKNSSGRTLVMVAGSLGKLLPSADLIPAEFRSAVDLVQLPDDAVAQGAARFCEWHHGDSPTREVAAAVDTLGNLLARAQVRDDKATLAWYDSLPVELLAQQNMISNQLLFSDFEEVAPTSGQLVKLDMAQLAEPLDSDEKDNLTFVADPFVLELHITPTPSIAAKEHTKTTECESPTKDQILFREQAAILGLIYLVIVSFLTWTTGIEPTPVFSSWGGAIVIGLLYGFAQAAINRDRYFAVLLWTAGLMLITDFLLQGYMVRSLLPFANSSYERVVWQPTAWSLLLVTFLSFILPLINSGWTETAKTQMILLAMTTPLITLLGWLLVRIMSVIFGPFDEQFVTGGQESGIGFLSRCLILALHWLPVAWAGLLLTEPNLQSRLSSFWKLNAK